MFRRKDEDIAQDLLGGAETEAAVRTEGMESGMNTEYKMNNTAANNTASPSAMPAAANTTPAYSPRPAEAPRPASAAIPATPVYRPAGATADASRGRVPEYRPSAPAQGSASNFPGTVAGAFGANDKSAANKAANRRVLTVGNDILLKGEIATCDRLVIEGAVDATLNEVHTVEIAEGGSFKGSAEIEDAEISGVFEGDLTVRNRLVIYATGKVRGKITYGEIEIERGGEMTGEIKTMAQAGNKMKSAAPAKKLEAVA